jgi:uncharacterized protein YbjT (DUF2867 family)
MSKTLFVTGASGFIGSEVCRIAILEGHNVIGMSRSGRPHAAGSWADKVDWVNGNVLVPDEWRDHLKGVDAVVHTVGIMRESPQSGHTYERVNGDAAEIVAWEAEQAGVQHFVFLSAEDTLPFISSRYVDAKRRAEANLRGREFHETLMRPYIVYGPGRKASAVAASVIESARKMPGMNGTLNRRRPLHVSQVAMAAVKAATEEGFEGVVPIDNIEYLAADDWKAYASEEDRKLPPVLPVAAGGLAAVMLAGLGWRLFRNR